MDTFLNHFCGILKNNWKPNENVLGESAKLITYARNHGFNISTEYDEVIAESINQKLDLCKKQYQHILDVAFQQRITLNYNLKKAIHEFVTSSNKHGYIEYLHATGIHNEELEKAFEVVTFEQSKDALLEVISSDKKAAEVVEAIFARAFYNLFEKKCVDLFFSKQQDWDTDYIDLLNRQYPDFSQRTSSLCFIEVDADRFTDKYEDGCNYYCNYIREYFNKLDNHTDIILTIPPLGEINGNDVQWELYADLILFAEKHEYHPIDRMYFRSKKVAEQTASYIKNLDQKLAHFEFAAEGFVFKDCFIVKIDGQSGYVLTLILEKNVRDERPINCPACRSLNVQGNSYPILNVRSWECKNPLCPDRSKYNRGKRFTYVSYRRQRAMEDVRNEIPSDILAKWHLDSVSINAYEEIFDMAIRFYSYAGDTVEVLSKTLNNGTDYLDRVIKEAKVERIEADVYTNFIASPYFHRFDYDNNETEEICLKDFTYELSDQNTLINGDSRKILSMMPDEIFNGAVTSPPYYNAKSYSQWENIYCYLFDMRNIAKEVYRTLKEGGVFLYNIFDYFDNERNIVFSAMGDKRMILGAYTIDLFRRLGFKIKGNIIWDKGEIQGNRNFNQGNNTPYYQAPLNCWEHVLIFSKGELDDRFAGLCSEVKKIKPFIKYVKGKNVLGHDAPYPEDVPNLLIDHLSQGDVVLDPFSGSYTTGLAANKKNIKSVCIEMRKEYIDLSINRFKNESFRQLELTDIQ